MIYVTGDTHIPIDISKLNTKHFSEQKKLTKDDYVIILGDFGLIWKSEPDGEERYWTKWLNEKNFTTLFLAGNHENHTRLNSFPITKKFKGNVHQISDSIFHLMDNNLFIIDNKCFYIQGGATSTDQMYRKENVDWWSCEIPTYEQCLDIYDFVKLHGGKVDFVLTHCLSSSYQSLIKYWYKKDVLTNIFDRVDNLTSNKIAWYCGHYHVDKVIDKKHIVLYNDIIKLT